MKDGGRKMKYGGRKVDDGRKDARKEERKKGWKVGRRRKEESNEQPK